MKKVYLSASTQEKNIAVSGLSEENLMHRLRDRVIYFISIGGKGAEIKVYTNTNKTWSLSQIVADSNTRNVDLHAAFHSNAGNKKVRGCECYYSKYNTNGLGKKAASIWYKYVSKVTPTSDRGVMSDGVLYDNGLYELRKTKAVACLMEHFFHTNKDDLEFFEKNIDLFAIAAAKFIYEYFGYTFKLKEEEQKNIYSDENLKWLYDNKLIFGTAHNPGDNFTKSEMGLILKRFYNILNKK